MIDIKDFWQSFRFSWFRRLIKTEAFWPNILLKSIQEATGEAVDKNELFEMGPAKILKIGKRLKNDFWKEVFLTVEPTIQGAIFSHPDKILISSFGITL